MVRKFWTAEEDQVMHQLYPNVPSQEVAEHLGRSLSAVYGRADVLGLNKTQEYQNSPQACRLRRGDNVGLKTRFKKGQTPVNKGLRRPGWGPGRMKETQFRAGQRHGIAAKNWCPIGTVRADPEGFLRIKLREGKKGEPYGYGNVKIWQLLNRHVWEQHHGPITPGHIVVFKDKNRANCTIENLELITLAENMRRNTIHRLPPELKATIMQAGVLKRRIREYEEENGKEQAV